MIKRWSCCIYLYKIKNYSTADMVVLRIKYKNVIEITHFNTQKAKTNTIYRNPKTNNLAHLHSNQKSAEVGTLGEWWPIESPKSLIWKNLFSLIYKSAGNRVTSKRRATLILQSVLVVFACLVNQPYQRDAHIWFRLTFLNNLFYTT